MQLTPALNWSHATVGKADRTQIPEQQKGQQSEHRDMGHLVQIGNDAVVNRRAMQRFLTPLAKS